MSSPPTRSGSPKLSPRNVLARAASNLADPAGRGSPKLDSKRLIARAASNLKPADADHDKKESSVHRQISAASDLTLSSTWIKHERSEKGGEVRRLLY